MYIMNVYESTREVGDNSVDENVRLVVVSMCTCVCIFTCIYAMYMYLYIVYMYLRMDVYVYVCIYYMYVYICNTLQKQKMRSHLHTAPKRTLSSATVAANSLSRTSGVSAPDCAPRALNCPDTKSCTYMIVCV